MPAMQTAAKSLIDQLSALAKNPGDIYISVVPFAKDVNIGASNYNQPWIDWTDWDAANGTAAPAHNSNKWGQCTNNGLDARQPQHLDRLRHRPRPGLRHQEHDADAGKRPDDVPRRGVRFRQQEILQNGQ